MDYADRRTEDKGTSEVFLKKIVQLGIAI